MNLEQSEIEAEAATEKTPEMRIREMQLIHDLGEEQALREKVDQQTLHQAREVVAMFALSQEVRNQRYMALLKRYRLVRANVGKVDVKGRDDDFKRYFVDNPTSPRKLEQRLTDKETRNYARMERLYTAVSEFVDQNKESKDDQDDQEYGVFATGLVNFLKPELSLISKLREKAIQKLDEKRKEIKPNLEACTAAIFEEIRAEDEQFLLQIQDKYARLGWYGGDGTYFEGQYEKTATVAMSDLADILDELEAKSGIEIKTPQNRKDAEKLFQKIHTALSAGQNEDETVLKASANTWTKHPFTFQQMLVFCNWENHTS